MTGVAHLVLIGLNYTNQRGSGDKNFWYELVPYFSKYCQRITIISVRNQADESYFLNGCDVQIKYVKPVLFEAPRAARKSFFWKSGAFPSFWGVFEKKLVQKKIKVILKHAAAEKEIDAIHLMDNFGFTNRFFARYCQRCSVTALAYQGKKPRLFYHSYLRTSYCDARLNIIATSNELADILRKIGVRRDAVQVIPWGIDPSKRERVLSSNEKAEIKRYLGYSANLPIVLWSGYIQQVKKKDFLYAYDIARAAAEKDRGLSFIFAFKPESFEKGFRELDCPSQNIHIKITNPKEFAALMKASDLFFSPVLNKDCIVAPPLTWLEALGSGLPLITTPVAGLEGLVENDVNGFCSWDKKELISKLHWALNIDASIQQRCFQSVLRRHNLFDISESYLKFFRR